MKLQRIDYLQVVMIFLNIEYVFAFRKFNSSFKTCRRL